MSIEQQILDRLAGLPPEKKLEVLDFAEFLRSKAQESVRRPRQSLRGALAHRGISISEEDIAEARREMWGSFPRDID